MENVSYIVTTLKKF